MLARSEQVPKAVLPEAVEFDSEADTPTAVLLEPVLVVKASTPTAVLQSPSVTEAKALLPTAVFFFLLWCCH